MKTVGDGSYKIVQVCSLECDIVLLAPQGFGQG